MKQQVLKNEFAAFFGNICFDPKLKNRYLSLFQENNQLSNMIKGDKYYLLLLILL